MTIEQLPTLNASLNATAAMLLLGGYITIKKRQVTWHRVFMGLALLVSAAFLTSYLIYHAHAGSTPYPHHDWTRPVYFTILIPHILLATVMTPFILAAVWYALRGRFDRHVKITRWLWPVWMFVSVSGVVIYWMLYRM